EIENPREKEGPPIVIGHLDLDRLPSGSSPARRELENRLARGGGRLFERPLVSPLVGTDHFRHLRPNRFPRGLLTCQAGPVPLGRPGVRDDHPRSTRDDLAEQAQAVQEPAKLLLTGPELHSLRAPGGNLSVDTARKVSGVLGEHEVLKKFPRTVMAPRL